jgi:hypothetical protein
VFLNEFAKIRRVAAVGIDGMNGVTPLNYQLVKPILYKISWQQLDSPPIDSTLAQKQQYHIKRKIFLKMQKEFLKR